jgi:hypothetical protein
VVWHALTRRGEYKGEFTKFRNDDCDAVDMLNSDGESITATALNRALQQEMLTGEPQAPEIDPEDAMIPSGPTQPAGEPGSP